jgi:Protein of unknown function (DUF4058)
MPLLDHSRPPLSDDYPWESIHSAWVSELARHINRQLPPRYFALENKKFGNEIEIDVGTFDRDPSAGAQANGPAISTLAAPTWAPPAANRTIRARLPDTFEVKVFLREGRSKLVGAIELVSPRNKDRPSAKMAFVAKCAGYLSEGVSVVVLDATTERRARLHWDLLTLFDAADDSDRDLTLFAAAYRPVIRNEQAEIDIWTTPIDLGQMLPTMPLRLTGDTMVPVDFEATYMDVCRDRRAI